MEAWPEKLTINAWTGEPQPASDVSAQARRWAVERQAEVPRFLAPPPPADLRDWRNPEVGWGLVLPEHEELLAADRAIGTDAPAPIRKLLADRKGAPVFRYRPDLHDRFLRRYYTDRKEQDIAIAGAPRGTGPGRLPRYLLLCGSPEVLPWDLQYVLNTAAFVGRLDLDETGLERYVGALMTGWKDASCQVRQPVVWTVDHGSSDITSLMRRAIAEPVAKDLRSDPDIGEGLHRLAGGEATARTLIDTLTVRRPALVVSTSHGMTGPLTDPALMAAQLGFLVDGEHALLGPGEFCGEECIALSHPVRVASASAIMPCVLLKIDRREMMRALHKEHALSDLFVSHLLARNARVQEDLVDQLFNSSEKRLARILLLLAQFGKEQAPEKVIPRISQEVLAEMVGTTRARVNFFMNRFRKLGFIEYNGEIEVHPSLLSVVLHD